MWSAASGTSEVPTRLRPSASTRYTCCMSVGKKPVPYMASSRTSTGTITGRKPLEASLLQGELHQRELQEDQVALEVGEAAARRAGAALHVDEVGGSGQVEVVERRERELPGRAPGVQHHGVLFAALGSGGVGQVGDLEQLLLERGLDFFELALRGP